MKKVLFPILALVLALSLALPMAMPAMALMPVSVDFESCTPGASVEGLGTVDTNLNIQTVGGNAVALKDGAAGIPTDPALYGAPNGAGSIKNGGLNGDMGFGDLNKVHNYVFTFASGVSVSEFSITMFDYGDYNPTNATYHEIKVVAYDTGMAEVDDDVLKFNSPSAANPRSSSNPNYGDLYYSGDAVDASAGTEPGNWTFTVTGTGITSVELELVAGPDPNIGFDDVNFIVEEPSLTITKSTDFEGRASLGDTIDYYYDVENTGDVILDNPTVEDDIAGTASEVLVSVFNAGDDNTDGNFDPGEIWEFTASYGPVDEDDLQNCKLHNIATATAYYEAEPYKATDELDVDLAKRVNLWAGKYTDVGYVEIWNDGENVHVIYQIDDGMPWEITEVHLYVGANLPPANTPGQFPFDIDDAVSVSATTVEFAISMDEIYTYEMEKNKKDKPTGKMVVLDDDPGVLPGDPIYVAAHSVVMDVTCYQTGVVYGIERNTGNVYGVDVLSGASSLEFTITPPPALGSAKPNGLAYDPVNGRFYFVDYQPTTTLYLWDGISQQTAGSLLLDAAGAPVGDIADADFYDGKYYFVTGPPSSDLLYEVAFNADGTASGPPTLIGNISAGAHGYTFNGDIAIKDGVIYGWGYCGIDSEYEFFSVDVDGSGFAYVTPTYQTSLQLAFGSDGTLYGHRSGGSGEFFEVGTGIADFGDVTSIGWDVQGQLYTDCASGEICIPTTETAWGGWGDDFDNIIDFEEANWSNYIEYFVMTCPAEEPNDD